jgi:hypothetical protein
MSSTHNSMPTGETRPPEAPSLKGQGAPPTRGAIALRADGIFLARGEGPGDVSHWLLAEQECV